MKKITLPFLGFLQATCLVIYIGLVTGFFAFAENWFPNLDFFYGPILMLLLFVVSAVISALLVLGRAGYLFWEKRYRECFMLLGWTIGWALFYLVAMIVMLLICQ